MFIRVLRHLPLIYKRLDSRREKPSWIHYLFRSHRGLVIILSVPTPSFVCSIVLSLHHRGSTALRLECLQAMLTIANDHGVSARHIQLVILATRWKRITTTYPLNPNAFFCTTPQPSGMQPNVAFYEKTNHLCFMEEVIYAGFSFRLEPQSLGLAWGLRFLGPSNRLSSF